MVRPEKVTGLACMFCRKITGVVKTFDNEIWLSLHKLAIERSKENLVGDVAVSTKKILGQSSIPQTEGYHVPCHRKYRSFKSSKRKRHSSDNSNEHIALEHSECLPASSNTLVAQIFSVASRTFADLSDLVMQLHPQEDVQTSKHPKYTQQDVDLLYKAVADFGDNIKQVTENLRQRHTDRMRFIQEQKQSSNSEKVSETPSTICASKNSIPRVPPIKAGIPQMVASTSIGRNDSNIPLAKRPRNNVTNYGNHITQTNLTNSSTANTRPVNTSITGFQCSTRVYPAPANSGIAHTQKIPTGVAVTRPECDADSEDFDVDDFDSDVLLDNEEDEIGGLEFEDDDDDEEV